jgi:hypothetical protein
MTMTMVWNDGGAEFPHKQAAKDEFVRFWQLAADDPRRTRDGLYHAQALTVGTHRVQIIGLDLRWFRSPWRPTDERGAAGKERYLPDADPTKTMLGDTQWRWLEAQLREPADVRLLVSSGTRSGCQNIRRAIASYEGVPGRHGNTDSLTRRHVGTAPPRSTGLYSGS